MENKKVFCPHCGKDIEELIREEVTKRIRQINIRKAIAAQRKTPEAVAEQNRKSAERLKKWREENPEQASSYAAKASHARTPETFARQSNTIKETNRRKALKFAELVMEAKIAGKEITPEMESDFMELAKKAVEAERKAERKGKK